MVVIGSETERRKQEVKSSLSTAQSDKSVANGSEQDRPNQVTSEDDKSGSQIVVIKILAMRKAIVVIKIEHRNNDIISKTPSSKGVGSSIKYQN